MGPYLRILRPHRVPLIKTKAPKRHPKGPQKAPKRHPKGPQKAPIGSLSVRAMGQGRGAETRAAEDNFEQTSSHTKPQLTWGVPKIRGPFLGSLYSQDHTDFGSMLGSLDHNMLGSLMSGNSHLGIQYPPGAACYVSCVDTKPSNP